MNCCEQNAPYSGCNQGRDCPVRQGTQPATPVTPVHPEGSEPSAPLAQIDRFLSPGEWAMVGAFFCITTGIWLVGLAVVSGFVWARWLSSFVHQATAWLVLP